MNHLYDGLRYAPVKAGAYAPLRHASTTSDDASLGPTPMDDGGPTHPLPPPIPPRTPPSSAWTPGARGSNTQGVAWGGEFTRMHASAWLTFPATAPVVYRRHGRWSGISPAHALARPSCPEHDPGPAARREIGLTLAAAVP